MKKIFLAGCVIVKDGKILLLHRRKANWYELPGGKINDPESAEEAAKRELKEELQCVVKIIKKIGSKDFIEEERTMGYIWFLAKLKSGQTPKIGEPGKFDHFEYLPIKELSRYKLSLNMQNFTAQLERGNINLL